MINVKYFKKKTELLYLSFHYKGERFYTSTGIYDSKDPKRKLSVKAAKDRLEKIIFDLYFEVQEEGREFSFDELKERLVKGGKKADTKNLIAYIEMAGKRRKVKPLTKKKFTTLVNRLNEFEPAATLIGADTDFIQAFISYLYENGLKQNTVAKYIKTLHSFLREAEEEGLEVNGAYRLKRNKVNFELTEQIYLRQEEMDKIKALDLSPRLEKVRDLFWVGCYTGLRYSDWSQVLPQNMKKINGKTFLYINQTKTSRYTIVPMRADVLQILEKWNMKLPIISPQKFNDYIKEVCELAGIEDFKKVSSHTCRRTFASLAYREGLPLLSIGKITGHATEKTLLTYIRVSEEEHALQMADYDFFK